MKRKSESPPPQRVIDAAAKAAFLAALRRGARREDAAAEAGFSLTGFYGARARDPAFAAGWAEALTTPPAAARRARAYEERGEVRIACANRRWAQRRRRAHVRFTEERQAVFLAHLVRTGDTKASAAAAGISESTAHLHRRKYPDFDRLHAEALAEGYELLEPEALRLALAAQRRLRAAMENALNPPHDSVGRGTAAGGGGASSGTPATAAPCPHCGHVPDEDALLDRTLRLLARHDRKPRRPESNFKPGGRRQRVTFEQAIRSLDKKLRAMGARTGPPLGEGED